VTTASREDITARRANAAEEEGELQRIRELGLVLVNQLFMASRTMAVHTRDNDATNYAMERLLETVRELIGLLDTVTFIVAEGEAYINDVRIRFEARHYSNLQHVVGLLDLNGVGGLQWTGPPADEELRQLIAGLNLTPDAEGGLARLREFCQEHQIPVGVHAPYVQASAGQGGGGTAGGGGAQGGPAAPETRGTSRYARGLVALRAYAASAAGSGGSALQVTRTVHDLVDLSGRDLDGFLKLHTIQGVEDPLFNHSVNVAALAIAVGRALGLHKVELGELGAAAMFHDVGYVFLAGDQAPDGEHRRAAEDRTVHPVAGAAMLAREKGYGPDRARRIRVALEHHLHVRRPGGYPRLPIETPSVYTRIVQVCDHYDALVAPDPAGGARRIPPARALQQIRSGAGERFDATVIKALVRVLGRYPYGTLVRLDDGRVGVTVSGGRSQEGFARPVVRLLRDAEGQPLDGEIDLLSPEHGGCAVERVLDPQREGIDLGMVFFQEDDVEDEGEGGSGAAGGGGDGDA